MNNCFHQYTKLNQDTPIMKCFVRMHFKKIYYYHLVNSNNQDFEYSKDKNILSINNIDTEALIKALLKENTMKS